MDECDRASEQEEALRLSALAEQARRAGLGDPSQWEHLSEKWCVECGNRIPDARRRQVPGVKRCVECQQIEEQYGRRCR